VIWIVPPDKTSTVILNYATISPYFSSKTGYEFNNSCSKHSLTPSFAVISSSKALNEKPNDGYLTINSLKKDLADLLFKLYAFSIALLNTVVLNSLSLGFPSPVLIIISRA